MVCVDRPIPVRDTHVTEGTGVFSIGEFSRITGLTVKTLRFYHEKSVLVPRLCE